MGWWQEEVKGKPIELGDEPLDLLHEAVAAVARVYQKERGRKPTMAEFGQSLLQTLGSDPAQFFKDMDAQVVSEIVFRLKKVPQRQKFAVGDYFAIPLQGKFWYGRILHFGAAAYLVEIYSLETDRMLTLRQLLGKRRKVVMNKHVFGQPSFLRGRWKIIGHEDIPADFAYPAFYGGMVAHGLYTVWRGDKETYEPLKKIMKYEPCCTWVPERIENALQTKQFDHWPEDEESKKDTRDNHDRNMRHLHEYFNIPLKGK
jgi:hypothetical protein